MKIQLFVILCAITSSLYAQQFSAYISLSSIHQMANINRDTVEIGYDLAATDTLDAAFNEINIYGVPRDTGLDVRIGNIWGRQNLPQWATQSPYQTRKQITPYRCGTNTATLIELEITSNKWPVYATWNRTLFQDSCREGTSLTNMHPNTWWVGQGFREVLASWNYHPIEKNQWYYTEGADTVYTYWIGLGDSESVQLLIRELDPDNTHFKLFPNPCTNQLHLNIPSDFGNISPIKIYSLSGTFIEQLNSLDADTRTLANGSYTVVVEGENNRRITSQFIKRE